MNAHLSTETIRRRDNGTVDIDFYRSRALSERRAAMCAMSRPVGRMIRPTIAVAILILMVWAMPPLRPTVDAGTLLASNADRSMAR